MDLTNKSNDSNESYASYRLFRPILCSFNPAPQPLSAETIHNISNILSQQNENSITVDPSKTNVPWFSTLQVCRQSIHWAEAERSAKHFLENLHKLSHFTGAKMPRQLSMGNEMRVATKQDDLIETSVACTIFQHPNGNAARAALIAQSMLLLWLQDDTAEFSPEQIGNTVSDVAVGSIDEAKNETLTLRNQGYVSFVEDICAEDKVLGQKVVTGMIAFFRDRGPERAAKVRQFKTLNDYLNFRTGDIGRTYNFATVEFARDINVTTEDKELLQVFEDIACKHTILVQDLYSFERERMANEADPNVQLINVVAVMRGMLGMDSYATSMIVVRDMIIQTEVEAKQEYERLRKQENLNAAQLSYVEGLFQFMAGHIYFSATAPRYGYMY